MSAASTTGSDRWIRLISSIVPFAIRRQFLGELLADRAEMQADGLAPWRIRLRTMGALMLGLVQHVPLVERCGPNRQPPEKSEKAAGIGWLLWRASGPLFFAGYLLSMTSLVVLGALALIGCFAAIGTIAATSGDVYGGRSVRTLNAVFGGLAALLALIVAAGILATPAVAASVALGATSLGAFSMQALVFFATTLGAAICLAGWVPEPWEPSRIIQH